MTIKEIMQYLEEKGNPQTKKVYTNHGAQEPFYGVKVADLKVIQKKVKQNHALALELFETGNADAQYLAGLISSPKEMSKKELIHWAKKSNWYMVSEYAVAWTVAESDFGFELAKEWINGDDNHLKCIGYTTLSSYTSIKQDEELDIDFFRNEVTAIGKHIHEAENRVKHTMNGFVIAVGGNIAALTEYCKTIGDKIGVVKVMMGKTACKTPLITPYIQKMEDKGRIGKKKKSCKC